MGEDASNRPADYVGWKRARWRVCRPEDERSCKEYIITFAYPDTAAGTRVPAAWDRGQERLEGNLVVVELDRGIYDLRELRTQYPSSLPGL